MINSAEGLAEINKVSTREHAILTSTIQNVIWIIYCERLCGVRGDIIYRRGYPLWLKHQCKQAAVSQQSWLGELVQNL